MMRDPCPSPVVCDPNCKYYKSQHCHAERYADHMIANGVTIQKWIPVTERLPDAWVDVLSCDRNKNLTVDCVDKKGKWYSEYKDLEEVTHWVPLPQPPKGE